MSKKHPEEVETPTTEYAEIFAKLAVDEDAETNLDEVIAVEGVTEEVAQTVADAVADAVAEAPDGEPLIEADDDIVPDETGDESDDETDEPDTDDESDENLDADSTEIEAAAQLESEISNSQPELDDVQITASLAELKPAIEAILFVADEPVPSNQLCKILGDVNSADVYAAIVELMSDYEARNSGLELREIAGGWRISTRPQHHEFIRKYLKSKPSARLSLPALETLAVIAYKQPVTVPEVLEIRGVSSSSAIKTLLEKRLIVTKGRKETVGKPMMYGTSKEFLIQFGLRDLNELPSIEDFEELAA
jgi:segregation and condensation protein B